jgi:hypothetical protein
MTTNGDFRASIEMVATIKTIGKRLEALEDFDALAAKLEPLMEKALSDALPDIIKRIQASLPMGCALTGLEADYISVDPDGARYTDLVEMDRLEFERDQRNLERETRDAIRNPL